MDELVEHLNELRLNCAQKHRQSQPQQQYQSLVAHSRAQQQQLIESRNDQRLVTINAIRRYAKTVLDVTWTHEKELTAQSFTGEHVNKKVNTIIYLLDSIYQLCEEMSDIDVRISDLTTDGNGSGSADNGNHANAVTNILGIDFAECLMWRKAALIYAFCSSLVNDGVISRDELCDEDGRYKFLTHLIDAIQWFRDMLSLRQPLIDQQLDKDICSDTLSLVSRNVFGDNHLLAMMYLSEMVFWYYKYSNSWHLFLHMDFDAQNLAKHCLTVYISAVDKCLNKLGWNCERAKHLLTILSHDSDSPTNTVF